MSRENKFKFQGIFFSLMLFSVLFLLQGCAKQGYSVIASTGTVIGVEISQNQTTQSPQAKLGYNRAEFAFVPTNRNSGVDAGTTKEGARDTANVIMELKYAGIFDLGTASGIYQRLAVGDIAVTTVSADIMMLKNADGTYSAEGIKALNRVRRIPEPDPAAMTAKAPISLKFDSLYTANPSDPALNKFNDAAKLEGYPKTRNPYPDNPAFRDFSIDPNSTAEQVNKVKSSLEGQGIAF